MISSALPSAPPALTPIEHGSAPSHRDDRKASTSSPKRQAPGDDPIQGTPKSGAHRALAPARSEAIPSKELPADHNVFDGFLRKAIESSPIWAIPVTRSSRASTPTADSKAKTAQEKAIGDVLPVGVATAPAETLPLALSLPAAPVEAAPPVVAVAGSIGAPSQPVEANERPENKSEEENSAAPPGAQAFTARIRPTEGEPFPVSSVTARKSDVLPPPPPKTEAPAPAAMPIENSQAPAAVSTTVPELSAPAAPTSAPRTPEHVPAALFVEPSAPPTKGNSPDPIKDITIQLPGARGVEVKLSEHAGEIRVDVRSGDSALTQDLRGNLHELVNGLERKGYTTEVSHLASSASIAFGDMASSKESSSDSRGDNSDQQQRNRQRQPEQEPDGQNRKGRSLAWNEAMELNLERKAY